MGESVQLEEPIFKLIIRFGNGELVNYVAREPLDLRMITPETRYAVISCWSLQHPADCTETTVVNLRDVTFIKTERVTLDQLAAERRSAGIRSGGGGAADDKLPKSVAQIKFV